MCFSKKIQLSKNKDQNKMIAKTKDADINHDNTMRLKIFRNKSTLKSFAFCQITVSVLFLLKNKFKINNLLPKFVWQFPSSVANWELSFHI